MTALASHRSRPGCGPSSTPPPSRRATSWSARPRTSPSRAWSRVSLLNPWARGRRRRRAAARRARRRRCSCSAGSGGSAASAGSGARGPRPARPPGRPAPRRARPAGGPQAGGSRVGARLDSGACDGSATTHPPQRTRRCRPAQATRLGTATAGRPGRRPGRRRWPAAVLPAVLAAARPSWPRSLPAAVRRGAAAGRRSPRCCCFAAASAHARGRDPGRPDGARRPRRRRRPGAARRDGRRAHRVPVRRVHLRRTRLGPELARRARSSSRWPGR